ncbi:single-stranded-DNA-specific exonuclease RecJ [Fructilactobacillus sanfranciscensis]|uniref:single-stranded-DNA-specific exonuclease RecJ n=1 Tax=Fructilactobacillus sanfranciscensis TaxID=1625 RepID=UPI000CD3E3A5|nr:single-stranded-DNA-specific exonuclease RecJ [Fructilactobacillus sanfranciscensis]POH12250.1 single-stranded-DNA-specific exonuclease RecJ [Fructilactobacillus sanfranciscensis]POH16251.1 single-stranded-DNA-specific exonuclease RecJ [Fructilactobacillus sanfranciscensis]POH18861.1 single-stranded-DNA-specific exonuclease RecJ [Fructilactobacillus sanfranciscensis]
MLSSKYDWQIKANHAKPKQIEDLASQLGISQLIAQLLINRGYDNSDKIRHFLSPDTSDLYDPFLLHDMDKAVERIQMAVSEGEKITIYGDYDADGLTSTSIMYETLQEIGANVNYYIPNRFDDGYGPNIDAYRKIISDGTTLIVTVDNGVSGFDAIEEANKLGCDVVITDHHELPKKLPNAYAIVHADLSPDYPFKYLSGAGIAFKVATALNDEIPQEKIDLAAIGTVADLVSMTGENRAIVQFGLNVIHLTERPGLKSLIKHAKLKLPKISEEDIGFKIAPSLNALGRMGDASSGVELLTTNDEVQADKLAKITEKKNEQRKELVAQIAVEAEQQAETPENLKRKILIIAGKAWQTGVLGIVASRISDKYHKPTVVLGIDETTGVAKGSGRSIAGFDLFKALDRSRDQMVAFGGHEMAVGLTISLDKIKEVSNNIEQVATEEKLDINHKPILIIDYEVNADDINDHLYEDLSVLSPFGVDNPKPEFAIKPNNLSSISAIGADKSHLKFEILGYHSKIRAIDFGVGSELREIQKLSNNLKVAGTLGKNEFRGRTNLQIMVDDLKVDGCVVIDQRTNKLVQQMFKQPGEYVFFNEKLKNKLTGYLNDESTAILANQIDSKNPHKKIIIVDCPKNIDDFKTLINKIDAHEIVLYLYKPQQLRSFGMPKREQYAKLFKFVNVHQNVKLNQHLKEMCKDLKIDQTSLVFMIKVFDELGFVTIQDGIMNKVDNPNKHPLSSASTYKQREQEIELENQLISLNQNALINLIQEMQNKQ